MVSLALINPLDQPLGRNRLLPQLADSLANNDFDRFRLIVAFAKVGPLLRLESELTKRRKSLTVEAIIGVDQQGTSAEALQFAIDHFDAVYVLREPNLTFHPKMYLFDGDSVARIFVGSNNLTVGGTETNFESALCVDLDLPADASTQKLFTKAWHEMLPAACPATSKLDNTLLSQLMRDGTVLEESAMRSSGRGTGSSIPRAPRSGLKVKPPSPLPSRRATKTAASGTRAPSAKPVSDPYSAKGLAIQIRPHHNGEIFLSVTAALQNPAFFKWPFTGSTVPKRANNPAYPQLTPDPRVRIVVYGAGSKPLLERDNYALNTVYYATKSEIRITASPLVGIVPDYSVMIMQESSSPNLDYEITIHTPASADYASWLAACNQSMPGGGKAPRKFGWF